MTEQSLQGKGGDEVIKRREIRKSELLANLNMKLTKYRNPERLRQSFCRI